MSNGLRLFIVSIFIGIYFLDATSYIGNMVLVIILGIILMAFLILLVGNNKKYNKSVQYNIEEKIDNGIYFCCMMLFIGFINGFFGFGEVIIFNNRKLDMMLKYLVLYACAFLSYSLLKKYRPPMKNANKGWAIFYKFILSQLDIEKAFRRNK